MGVSDEDKKFYNIGPRSVAPPPVTTPVQEYRNFVSHQYEAPYEQVLGLVTWIPIDDQEPVVRFPCKI